MYDHALLEMTTIYVNLRKATNLPMLMRKKTLFLVNKISMPSQSEKQTLFSDQNGSKTISFGAAETMQ